MIDTILQLCFVLLTVDVLAGDSVALADDQLVPQAARVATAQVNVGYEVTAPTDTETAVTLWFTTDEGTTWRLFGRDGDGQSPVEFVASQEGLHGFYVTAQNEAGASASEPATGTRPQVWAFVDFTPPIAQLHQPRFDSDAAGERRLIIRWSAIDDHLDDRPVTLGFRGDLDGTYNAIVDRLANTGQFEWPMPQNLTGEIELRLVVTDRGGNVAQSVRRVEIDSLTTLDDTEGMLGVVQNANGIPREAPRQVSDAQRQRAARLMQQSRWHKERGERTLAIARMRDALRADPTQTQGLVDLANLLYADGQYEDALQAYQLGLTQQPALRSGLEGLARVMIRQRRFLEADEALQRIVEMSPNDAEAWLHLSDVAVYRGDEVAARRHLAKATTVDPQASEIIRRAELRLAGLNDLLERYYAKRE